MVILVPPPLPELAILGIMLPTLLIAIVVIAAWPASVDGALPCAFGQWCWQAPWSNEYLALPQVTAAAIADAAAVCSNFSATVVTGDAESLLVIQLLTSGNASWNGLSWWTSLGLVDASGALILLPMLSTVPSAPSLNLTAVSSCFADATCCFAITTRGVVGGGCPTISGTNWSVICSRSGSPSAWITTNSSEMELGFFSRRANFSEASSSCSTSGGSLAYISPSLASLLPFLLSRINVTFPMFVGFSMNVVGTSVWQLVPSTTRAAITPFAANITLANKCGAILANGSYSLINCSLSQAFVCQRVALPNASSFCNMTSGTLYSYFPASGSRVGVSPAQAIQQCQATGGEMTKFAYPSEIASCFGAGAMFLTTCYSSGVWGDLSSAPVPPYFSASTGLCTFYNASGPSAGPLSCTGLLPNVCEYTLGSTINGTFASQSVTLGSQCSVTFIATLSRPPAWNESVMLCRDGAAPVDCTTWQQLQTTASLTVRGADYLSSLVENYTMVCVPPSMCVNETLSLLVLPQNVTTNVTLGNQTIDQTGASAPRQFRGVIGVPLVLPPFAVSSSGSYNVSASFAIIPTVDSAKCTVSPQRRILAGVNTQVTLTTFCDGGTNSTSYQITVSIGSVDRSTCAVPDFASLPIATILMSLGKTVIIPNATYFGFGPSPSVTVQMPPLSNFLGSRWLCLAFLSSNVTGAVGTNACVSSDVPLSALRSTVLTFSPPVQPKQSFVLTYQLTGNAVGSIDVQGSSLNVTVQLLRMNITLDCGLSTIPQYKGLPFAVTATIPFPVPSGYNLTLNTLTAGQPWSNPCSTYLNLSTTQPWLLMQIPVGASTAQQYYLPTQDTSNPSANWNANPGVSVSGNASYLFNLPISASGYCSQTAPVPLLVILLPSALNYTQLPSFLFYNAQPYPVTISIPLINPLRNQAFTLSLSCTTCPTGALTIVPSAISFTSLSNASQTMALSAFLPLQNVQLVWQFSPRPPQYLTPPNFTLSTRNQSAITPAMVPLQFYFVSTVYALRLIASSPPPQSNVTVQLGSGTSGVTTSPAVFNTSSALTQYLQFMLAWAPSTQLVTLPLVIGGADFSGFFLSTDAVLISPVLPQINVTVLNVPLFLLNTTSTATLTVTLDRAPVSYAVTLTITSSPGIIAQPSSLQWLSSSSKPLTLAVASTSLSNANAFISISVLSTMIDGTSTNEAASAVNWCNTRGNCSVARTGVIRIPVLFPVTYAITPSTFPFPMRIGDRVVFTLSIGLLPFTGNVTFVFGGFSPYFSVNPSALSFNTSSSSTRQQFLITALAPTQSLLLIPSLVGEGRVFYLAPTLPVCLYVDRSISAIPKFTELSGLAFVNGQVAVNGTLGLSTLDVEQCTPDGSGFSQLQHQLPVPGTMLTMSLSTVPLGALVFLPSSLTWRAGDALLKDFVTTPTGQVTGPVSIVFSASGNASTYTSSSIAVAIRNPSNVTVQFPTAGAFPTEQLSVVVNVTQLPVVCSTSLIASLSLVCLTARCSPSLVDVSAPLVFDCGSPVQQQFTLSMQTIDILTSVQVSVVFSGNAAGEYMWNGSVTTSSVTFFPRRTATVTYPDYIFVSSPFVFNITLSDVPDSGTTVHFRAAGYQLTQLVFSSTSPNTQSMSLVSPYMPESAYLNITLVGSTNQETNRYDPIEAKYITVREKVSMNLFQSTTLRTSQVIGRLNNQTVRFVISRKPLFAFTATMTSTSPVANLLEFSPPSVTFTPDDTDLSATVTLWGNAIGSATNVRFVLDGFADELAPPDPQHKILPLLLTILPLQTVKFNGTFSSMYVGANNNMTIAVFISIPCNLPVVVALNFSFSWAAQIEPNQVVFDPSVASQSRNVVITGLNATTGFMIVSLVSGPEFSPVVDGFMEITIIPRITATIYRSGTQIMPNSTVFLRSDAFTTFDFSISSIDLQDDGLYNLSIVRSLAAASCSDACYLLVNDSFVFYSAQSINAGKPSEGFGRSFGIATAAKVADNFTLVVKAVDSPKFAPGFSVYFRVAPEPVLNVTAPSSLYDGPLNAKVFTVSISYVLPGTTFQYTMSNKSCDSVSIVAARDMSFSQAIMKPVPVTVACNYSSALCELSFRKIPFLKAFPAFLATFPTDFFLLTTSTISLRRSPVITPLNLTSAGIPVTLPFRFVQRGQQVLMANIVGGQRLRPYVNFTYALLYAFDTHGIQAAQQTADIIITTTSSVDAEPKGLLSLQGQANLFNLTLGNQTQFAMSIGPLAGLLLVENEVVTVTFTNNAFDEKEFPDRAASGFSFVIEKYIASIVASSDLILVGSLTLGAFAAIPLASPALIPQMYKANTLLQLFACPNGQWFTEIWPFPSLDSEPDTLPTWVTISVSATGGVLLLTVLHFAAVVATYFFRRITQTTAITTVTQSGEVAAETSTGFSTLCGNMHFPAAPFCVIMAVAQPVTTFSFATLYYSTLPAHRILGFLCASLSCIVFPACFHGIVWRSRSLLYINYLNSSSYWFLPSGFWDHPTSATYIARYWPLFSDLRQNFRWFVLADYLAMMVTAGVMAVQPSSQAGCVSKVATICAIVLFQFFGAVFLQPYRFRYLNVMFALIFGLQFAGLVMLANQVNQQIRDDVSQTQSLRIFTASSALLLVTSLSTIIARCIPHESKAAARRRFYHERELHVDSDEELGIIERHEIQPPIIHLSDSDGEADPVAQKLADELASMPASSRTRRPVGLFRSGRQGYLKGGERSFSPSRRRQLIERDQLSEIVPTPALILPEMESPSGSPGRYEWVHEGEKDNQKEQDSKKKASAEEKRVCRFVETSDLF